MMGYIYRIIAPGSNSVYVGQSTNPLRRFKQHLVWPSNPALASFLKKHLDAEVYFWPALDMAAEEIADEQTCRDMGFHLLNCTPCGGRPPSALGRKRSSETCAKMSASLLGHQVTSGARANMSAAQRGNRNHLGHKHTPEARAKIRAARKRQTFSVEHRAKLSIAMKRRNQALRPAP